MLINKPSIKKIKEDIIDYMMDFLKSHCHIWFMFIYFRLTLDIQNFYAVITAVFDYFLGDWHCAYVLLYGPRIYETDIEEMETS